MEGAFIKTTINTAESIHGLIVLIITRMPVNSQLSMELFTLISRTVNTEIFTGIMHRII